MNITRHYHVGDTLQRSIVSHGGRICRRIARWVRQDGELTPEIPLAPIWQERQNDGEFHKVSEGVAGTFEKLFIEALIAANRTA